MILAIETSLSRSSISIFEEGAELGFRTFQTGTSVASFLLNGLEDLLVSIKRQKSEIIKILVSVGPGSLTGIRVGISIANGLAYSLNIECLGVSLLESLAFSVKYQNVISVIRANKTHYYWQSFQGSEKGEIEFCSFENAQELKNEFRDFKFIVCDTLETVSDGHIIEIVNVGEDGNLSKYLCNYFHKNQLNTKFSNPLPLYFVTQSFKRL